MKLDAGTIFDRNEAAFSAAMGTPESANAFRERYIAPALKACHQDGLELEAAYLETVTDHQREGFIAGFKAAVQLFMCCMPGAAANE